MEQYSDLNVHGKIKQLVTQGTDEEDVVVLKTLDARVPSAIPEASAGDDGKAPVVTSGEYVLTPVGIVDDVKIDGGSSLVNKTAGTTGYKTATIPLATDSAKGVVQVGDNISVTSGTISVPVASSNTPGVVKVGTTLSIANGVLNGAYSAGTGISLGSDNVINHSNSVTAGTAGPSSDSSGASVTIPYATFDAQGHITGKGTHTHTISNLDASAIASGTLASARLPTATTQAQGAVTLVAASGDSSSTVPTNAKMEAYVADAVATATANFLGTLDVEDDLGLPETASQAQVQAALNQRTWSTTPTKNDYCFVKFDLEQDPGNVDRYDRYKYTGAAWLFEYSLNNSSFTEDQWAAINSQVYNSTYDPEESPSTARKVDAAHIVVGPNSSVDDHIVTFNGTEGNLIQDSGYTIATSVPSGALFTDQKVKQNLKPTTDADAYPIILKGTKTATDSPTGEVNYAAAVKVTPSTGNVSATRFNNLALTAAQTGFTIAGGTTSKTLTVPDTYTLGDACEKGYADSSTAEAIGTGQALTTERDVYNGLPTINGAHNYTSSTALFAPTTAGTNNYLLKSNGSGAPTWIAQSSVTAGAVPWSGITNNPVKFIEVQVPPSQS